MTVNYYLFSVHVCHYFTVYVFFFCSVSEVSPQVQCFWSRMYFRCIYFSLLCYQCLFLYTSKLYLTYEGKPVKFTKNLPVVVNLESYNQHSLTIQQTWTAFPLN